MNKYGYMNLIALISLLLSAFGLVSWTTTVSIISIFAVIAFIAGYARGRS